MLSTSDNTSEMIEPSFLCIRIESCANVGNANKMHNVEMICFFIFINIQMVLIG